MACFQGRMITWLCGGYGIEYYLEQPRGQELSDISVYAGKMRLLHLVLGQVQGWVAGYSQSQPTL